MKYQLVNRLADSGFFLDFYIVSRWREVYSFWGIYFLLSLKFQKGTSKIEVFLSLPCWLSQFS